MKVFYCKDSKEGRVTAVSSMSLETLSGKSCDLSEYGLPTFNRNFAAYSQRMYYLLIKCVDVLTRRPVIVLELLGA
jgi:hypothetical protein